MSKISKTIIIISMLAIANALYLTYFFIQKKMTPEVGSVCDINDTLSCSDVITSQYSQIFGVPICVFALVVYPILIYFAYRTLTQPNTRGSFYVISIVSAMGMIMNLVYIYNEFAYIKAYCMLCILCGIFIITNFILSVIGYNKSKS